LPQLVGLHFPRSAVQSGLSERRKRREGETIVLRDQRTLLKFHGGIIKLFGISFKRARAFSISMKITIARRAVIPPSFLSG
jgi:hypothetical protein